MHPAAVGWTVVILASQPQLEWESQGESPRIFGKRLTGPEAPCSVSMLLVKTCFCLSNRTDYCSYCICSYIGIPRTSS